MSRDAYPLVGGHPSRGLIASVACVAGAMLLFEVVVTRLFSVLFFYHFSFFAISLVMSGLVIGGILASRWNVRAEGEEAFRTRLSTLALTFAAALLGAVLLTCAAPLVRFTSDPTLPAVAAYAL